MPTRSRRCTPDWIFGGTTEHPSAAPRWACHRRPRLVSCTAQSVSDARTRREWLKDVGGAGAASLLAGAAGAAQTTPAPQAVRQPNGTILPLTSTSDVFTPARGRSFQKFSFDF